MANIDRKTSPSPVETFQRSSRFLEDPLKRFRELRLPRTSISTPKALLALTILLTGGISSASRPSVAQATGEGGHSARIEQTMIPDIYSPEVRDANGNKILDAYVIHGSPIDNLYIDGQVVGVWYINQGSPMPVLNGDAIDIVNCRGQRLSTVDASGWHPASPPPSWYCEGN